MEPWDDLKVELEELRQQNPGALMSYPDPRSDRDRQPPFRIGLAAWATDVAARLHGRFGGDVALVVGALAFPSGTLTGRRPSSPVEPELDPTELTAELEGPVVIRSGYTQSHGLLIHNRSTTDLALTSNGQLTAVVVDPSTGGIVGGYTGAHRLPLVVSPIAPGATLRMPLLVATASFVPALGYRVPPGAWALRAIVHLRDGRVLRTASLPCTVTS